VTRVRQLIELDQRLLEYLGRARYATREQLAAWCEVHPATVSRRLQKLATLDLVAVERQTVPAIWALALARVALPNRAGRRRPSVSWSVMSHACHANEAELALRCRHPGFRLLDRLTLLRHGFNPAHGEHAGVDTARAAFFVLLDDYRMPCERIEHAWTRRHAPHRGHFPDATGRAWRDAVHYFYVVTTDPAREALHRAYLAQHGLPAEVLSVKALWRE
jgi:hypothetical protein